MKFDYVIYLLVSLLSSFASYYLTNNILFLIVTLFIFLAFFLIFELCFFRKEKNKIKKGKDLNVFIHDFFLTYCVNFSIEEAMQNGSIRTSKSFQENLKMLDEFKMMEKLEKLTDYFSSSLYFLFLKTVNYCENMSEDRVKTISFLLEENNRYILNESNLEKRIAKAFGEFAILWIISFLILIILRFSINNYFAKLSTNIIYLSGIAIYFLFFLFSIYLFMQVTLGRIKDNE